LAEAINVDPTLLRLVLVVTAFFSGGVVIPLYLIACLVIPREPFWGDPADVGAGCGFGGGFAGGYGGGSYGGTTGAGYGGSYKSAGYTGHGGSHNGGSYTSGGFVGHSGASSAGAGHSAAGSASADLDDMMKDIERKALQKELEELRAKVAKFEAMNKNQNNNNPKGDE
jgi:hypothetical protein